jgi:hypothetical protein
VRYVKFKDSNNRLQLLPSSHVTRSFLTLTSFVPEQLLELLPGSDHTHFNNNNCSADGGDYNVGAAEYNYTTRACNNIIPDIADCYLVLPGLLPDEASLRIRDECSKSN